MIPIKIKAPFYRWVGDKSVDSSARRRGEAACQERTNDICHQSRGASSAEAWQLAGTVRAKKAGLQVYMLNL